MKYIITENQYKRLKENHEDDFNLFITEKFPNIDKLKMVRGTHPFTGPFRKYVDPEKNTQYFKIILKSPPKWEAGAGLVDTYSGIRLVVLPKVYSYANKYGSSFEYDLIDWFNKTYDENAEIIFRTTK
jgi:hypothetical protein